MQGRRSATSISFDLHHCRSDQTQNKSLIEKVPALSVIEYSMENPIGIDE